MAIWLTAHAIAHDVDQPSQITLPAMLPNLHIRLKGTSRYIFSNGETVDAPAMSLLGPTLAAYRVDLSPGAVVISTGFLPAGWMSFVGHAATELADQLVDGALVWKASDVERLSDHLAGMADDAARCRLVEAFLMQCCRGHGGYERSASAAIDRWLEHSPRLELRELQAMLDVGERQMRRLTLHSHGASPKMLAMKYRALRAAAKLAVHGPSARDDALMPYADQAHLIRDFRRFTGYTPTSFVEQQANVAAATLSGRQGVGITRRLSLWS